MIPYSTQLNFQESLNSSKKNFQKPTIKDKVANLQEW